MDNSQTSANNSTDSEQKTETKPERTLAEEVKDFGEHFPKMAALVSKAAKYFGG